jgi:CubicO group peptidase (beta-lactamase class C family)
LIRAFDRTAAATGEPTVLPSSPVLSSRPAPPARAPRPHLTPTARPVLAALALLALCAGALPGQTPYYPDAHRWERRTPAQVGLDSAAVAAAVAYAQEHESTAPRDLLENHRRTFGREPHGEAVGPFRDRGPATGLIVRHGYIVGEWGEPERVDNTFSVTKSFLSTVVGVAWDRGLIPDLHRPVGEALPPTVALIGAPGGAVAPGVTVPRSAEGPVPGGAGAAADVAPGVAFHAFELLLPFESPHNAAITWDHLLRQTSEWQGTLWGKPDWADRPRGELDEWRRRPRPAPGTVYAYNDVRVNLLALAALNLWRRPLPQVLREHVMDPIGASPTWRWFGYDNSWVVLDGQLVQSVSGGAHWGGGMFISARDMARFGLLTLRRGRWGDRQILSEDWLRMATTPGTAEGAAGYGFMNYFLDGGAPMPLPGAPPEAFFHLGAGANIIYVDPVHDLVIVLRWIAGTAAADGVVRRVLAGIER